MDYKQFKAKYEKLMKEQAPHMKVTEDDVIKAYGAIYIYADFLQKEHKKERRKQLRKDRLNTKGAK